MQLVVLAVALTIAACNLKLPDWDGPAPPVSPREDSCGSGALTRLGRTFVHRMPYLQSVEEAKATVVWAGLPEHGPRVSVARKDDPTRTVLATFLASHPSPEPLAREKRAELYEEYDDEDEGGEEEDEEAELDLDAEDFFTLAAHVVSLSPDRRLCYRLDTDRGPLTEWASLTFAQAPNPERVDRFIVLGDSGTGRRAQRALERRIAGEQMDAILFLGDIAYRSGTHDQIQARFFAIYAGIFQRIPVYAAIGNHDIRTDDGRPFEDVFWLPGNERWYSFDLGDVHFVVLDTTRIGPEQVAWLELDLARSERQFTVVLAHHPPFTSARRGPSRSFQTYFVPLLERHAVDLVLTGHEHHYERTKPINGIVYVVSGGGGARLTSPGRQPYTERAVAKHHFLILEAHGRELRVRAVDIDGKTIDEFDVRCSRRTAGLHPHRPGRAGPGG